MRSKPQTNKFIKNGILIVLLMLTGSAYSQFNNQCGSDRVQNVLLQTHPDYAQSRQMLDSIIQERMAVFQTSENFSFRSNDVYQVPIVVHIIHIGEPVGTGSNISDSQVQSAIDGMNETWSNITGNSIDMQIDFCLARRDPNGNPTNGIVRVDGSVLPDYAVHGVAWDGEPGADYHDVNDLSRWPVTDYYNVWVVHNIQGSAAAFANTPALFPFDYDGTVIEYHWMDFNNGTLAHELGHGMNLYHTFAGDDDGSLCPANGNCLLDGDKVCDTPPHRRGDCGTGNPCSSSGDFLNSSMNYMSYCGSGTSDRFTPDQKTRTHLAFQFSARRTFLSSDGCVPVTAVDAAVTKVVFPDGFICSSPFAPVVRIKNYGVDVLTNVQLNYGVDNQPFQTHSVAVNLARDASIDVTLPTMQMTLGNHNFTCFSSNPNNTTDGYFDNDTIETDFYYAQPMSALPMTVDFENGPYPPAGFIINSTDSFTPGYNYYSWEPISNNCYGTSYFLNNWDSATTTIERNHDLISQPIEMNGFGQGTLSFDVSYRRGYDSAFNPLRFDVDISTDCGLSFTNIYSKSEMALETVSGWDVSQGWFPTSCNEWRRETVDISPYVGDIFILRFRCNIQRYATQNFYLDNISIDASNPACPAPGNLNVFVSGNTATLVWDPVPDAISYVIRGHVKNAQQWVQVPVVSGFPFYTAVGLANNLLYEWQVKAICLGGPNVESAYSPLHTFGVGCTPPVSHSTVNVTSNSAFLAWEPVNGAYDYQIKGRQAGTNAWVTLTVDEATPYFNALGLSPGTSYQWKIRTICNQQGNQRSAFTALTDFTTPSNKVTSTTDEFEVRLFPNPAQDFLNLDIKSYETGKTSIKILNNLGQALPTSVTEGSEISTYMLNINHLPHGIFFLVVQESGNEKVLRFVKK